MDDLASKQTILIVDDEALARKLHSHILSADYNVFVAHDGEEGLRMARELKPDLVLADNVMPGKSGIDLLLDIRADAEIKDTPAIIVSGLSEAKHRVKGLEAGADDYISKPFDLKELKVRVDTLLLKKSYEKRLNAKNEQLNAALKELHETQAELLHKSKLASIGELSAGIAHEINNPALAVNNAIEIIERKVAALEKGTTTIEDAEPELTRFIDVAKDALFRIRNIVDSLTTFSCKNREGMGGCDLSECIDSTFVILNHQVSDVTLHKNYLHSSTIEADSQQLNQVFMNLILNAVYAIMQKRDGGMEAGNIWIDTECDEEQVFIAIKDDGIGISSQVQDKIFDPFFTTKDVGKGTGLGLDISYRIIRAHHGQIGCSSKENEGTTFTISLPKKQLNVAELQA